MADQSAPPPEEQPTRPDAAPTAPQQQPQPTKPAKDPLRGSRTSGFWASLIAMAVLLLLLVIFIAQNTDSVDVAFLGWDGSTPLALALLIAVLAGLLVGVIAGTLRILQLRRRVKRG